MRYRYHRCGISSSFALSMKQQNGFTLIELLLYLGIAAVVLLGVSIFISLLLQARIKNQTVAEVEQQGAAAMQIMTQALRNANVITSPAAGSSAASISFSTFATSTNPTTFNLASTTLQITEGASSAVALTNARVHASNLNFSNLSRASTPGIVRLQFTLTYYNPGGRNEYNYAKTFIGSAALR